MALCGGVGAMVSLPSELIVHIFSFLPDRDKLRASAACRRWRECLFHPSLWAELQVRVGGGTGGGGSGSEETPKLEFLMRKFGSFVRDLQLEFAPVEGGYLGGVRMEAVEVESRGGGEPPLVDGRWRDALTTYLDQVLCVLGSIRNNRNLRKLNLYGDTCVLQEDGILDTACLTQVDQGGKKIKEIQQLFLEVLSNSRQLRWLSSSFMLGVVTPCSLASLSNASAASLEHLSLLDNRPPLLILPPPLLPAPELDRLLHLRSLALDFSDLTSDLCHLLASPQRTPLHRLSLLLRGGDHHHHHHHPHDHANHHRKRLDATATDDDWKALVRRGGNLRVYLMALDVGAADLLRVLKPSMPLERVHLDSYGAPATDGVLELLSTQYGRTLRHFLLLRDSEDAEPSVRFPDLSVNRNEDPLVLLAWRCTHLAVLVVHGYTVWSHNLVAISRLRGSSLKVLAVSEESIDFDPDQASVFMEGDPVHNLVKEVSLGLGRAWDPCLDPSLVLSEPTQHFHRELQGFSLGM